MTQKYIEKIFVVSIILIIIVLIIKNYGKDIKESFHNFPGYRYVYYKNKNDSYNRLRNYHYTNPQYQRHHRALDRYPSAIHSTYLVGSNNLFNHTCNNQYECPNMLQYPERSYPLTYPHLVSYYI
jgi:hypothetical protein